jgi:hypothetical protein
MTTLWGPVLNDQHIERDQRYPFENDVQLLIPFHPWFLRLCLKGINMSTSGVLTMMNPQNLGPGITLDDLLAILIEGDRYQVQLTSDFDHIESAVLNVRLRRKKVQSNSLKFAFSFDDQSEHLYGLIHELKQTTRGRAAICLK